MGGKLKMTRKQESSIETMYKTRSLEAGCINNGLTQLQTIFGELIRERISKAQGLGLRKILSSFISLNSAYSVLFTLSASANNAKVTKATLNFAKQTQLVKVDTKKAKAKIDKDAIIKELTDLVQQLRQNVKDRDLEIIGWKAKESRRTDKNLLQFSQSLTLPDTLSDDIEPGDGTVTPRIDSIHRTMTNHEQEEKLWLVDVETIINPNSMSEQQMKAIFDEFDGDGDGTISAAELQKAFVSMDQNCNLQQIEEMIEEIDTNGDGEVDFQEFQNMAGKQWFLDAFENKMAKAIILALNRHMDDDDGGSDSNDDDDDDDRKEHSKQSESADYIEQIEALNMKLKTLQERNASNQEDPLLKDDEMAHRMHSLIAENARLQTQIDELSQMKIETSGDMDNESIILSQYATRRDEAHADDGNQSGTIFWNALKYMYSF